MHYDPVQALAAIDAHRPAVLACLVLALGFSFVYFLIAVRMALRQKVYVEPFLGASVFFWHDLSFAANWPVWQSEYGGHWWLAMWSIGLCGTVALEAFLIWQFIRYGHEEIMPSATRPQFAALTIAGVLGVGAMWWLVKETLDDPLFFVTFAITAIWSTPFHTGIMLRRRNTLGQSVAMNASVVVIFAAVSAALMIAVPAFRSLPYYAFLAVFLLWPIVNIAMIRKFDRAAAGTRAAPEPTIIGHKPIPASS